MKQLWYVYVDWTLEDTSRPFYVGKGNKNRVKCVAPSGRNLVHFRIRQKHGIHRTLVFESFFEDRAYAVERVLIRRHKTYAHGGKGWWGANLDLGGEGGRSTPKQPAHREKIRQFMRTRTGEKNSFYGKRHDPTTIERISASMQGELGPCYGRTGAAHPMFGKQHTLETKARMSATHRGQSLTEDHIARIRQGHSWRKQLREERDAQVTSLLDQGLTCRETAERLSISVNLVYGATHRRNLSETKFSKESNVVTDKG